MITLTEHRFPPEQVEWKPITTSGKRALGGAYVDVRYIQQALDELAPGWHCEFIPWGEGRIICKMKVDGVVRSDVGEGDTAHDASNQAFRRAACSHGLGRVQSGPGDVREA